MTRDAHDGGDSPRKTTKGPKSGLKKENTWNLNNFASSGSHKSPDPRNADPGLGSGPKSGSGLIRWHQSGEQIRVWPLDPTRTALPPTGTGTQHTLGPVQVGCLGHCAKEKEWPILG